MRLKKEQKLALLKWIAEGLETAEINDRAAGFEPAFEVSRQQINYYRKSRDVQIKELQEKHERDALNEGLAKKSIRIRRLKKLARDIEKDLFLDNKLWLEDEKGVGAGAAAKVVSYHKFNRSEIDAYRAILDDIASELGHRTDKVKWDGELIFEVVYGEKEDENKNTPERVTSQARRNK